MKRALACVFLIFFILVTANYFITAMQDALQSMHANFSPEYGGSGPSFIDFSFFDKGGVGRNYITQGYGRTPYSYLYAGDWHDGIDIAAQYGAPIYSASGGTVIATGDQDNYCYHRGFGKYVAVKDSTNNLVLWYAHLGTISVSVGDTIKKEALIGTVGMTGFETGTHLHFSIFDVNGFSMENKNGCGPDPTGKDLDPLLHLGMTYQ
jgi:murein DD-endopeptidase MepM/ murein hydrolase activator NlpD